MEKETIYLEKQVGRSNPFRVPEGYFDSLPDEVMKRIDAAGAPAGAAETVSRPRKKARLFSLRPVIRYAAASVAALVICAAVYVSSSTSSDQQEATAAAATVEDASFDEVADYMMLDNADIYACLSSDY